MRQPKRQKTDNIQSKPKKETKATTKPTRKRTETASESIKESEVITRSSEPRKSRKTKKKEDNEPKCYSLFDFSSSPAVASRVDSSLYKSNKKKKDGKSEAAQRTQDTGKKSDKTLQRVQKADTDSTKTKRGSKGNEISCPEDGKSVSRKRGDKGIKTEPRKAGEGKSESARKTRSSKQPDAATEQQASRRTTESGRRSKKSGDEIERKGRKEKSEEVVVAEPKVAEKKSKKERESKLRKSDIVQYKLTEFPEDSTTMGSTSIQLGPVETSDPWLVEIVIDNKRYRVSPWSIKGNNYIQGLDSHFLVHRFRGDLRKIEKENKK